jgi:DNA-binding NtrC family response regulator
MNAQVLCIVGSAVRWHKWRAQLAANGCKLLRATDETQAIDLLSAHRVDVICIDSQTMADARNSYIGVSLKNENPRVPIVLIQTDSTIPSHFEQLVDVMTDEASFEVTGSWMIQDLHEVRFPLFV